jgi:acetyl-CoA carboxylase carboxyl transferase subunit alpha
VDIVLDFERPVVELRKRIAQLRELQETQGVDLSASIDQLELQASKLQDRIFTKLTPWQRTQLARHPERPYMLDYVGHSLYGFTELHGDRAGYDDNALVTGFARFKAREEGDALNHLSVAVIGHQKGRNTKENIFRNFGMARPDGYRKALRVMHMAERFGMPILCFIDTPGAYPGIEAEARGQAEAIARNIMEMATFTVPIICTVIGEGGSGGALAVGVGNRVLMLENSIYSVISPEGCAAILWRDRAEGPTAAAALRITAQDCLRLSVADDIIPEPACGAHRDHPATMAALDPVLDRHLSELMQLSPEALRVDRYQRFRKLGEHIEA